MTDQPRDKQLKEEIENRIRIEESLQKTRDVLQTVFDGITDPLIMLDADMAVKILNDAALNYYGKPEPDVIVGECCFKALKGETMPCKGCEIPSAILSGEARIFERKGFMDSNRIEQVAIYPVKIIEDERAGAIIRISDITETKLVQRQLIQSEKLASLGLLISGIAHEINNPSNFITLNIPVMRDYMNAVMPIVNDYVTRITSIVSDLTEFARMEDTKKQVWIDIKSIIEKSIGICESQIKKRIKYLNISIQEDLPKVFTNSKAIEQVLINLLVNAAQAADKEDSRVKLDVSMDKTSQSNLIIEVEDNGCGMDEKTRNRLFDPFFTTKSLAEGTGLGLYISNNLIEALGGRIEVESEPGKGSMFRVILPNVGRK
jgi:signal transduction histidine kinase